MRGCMEHPCLFSEGNGGILENNTSLDKEMMGEDTYFRLRRITDEILKEAASDNTELATLIDGTIDRILQQVDLSEKLQRMFRKCMLNTITTTLVQKKMIQHFYLRVTFLQCGYAIQVDSYECF